MDNSLAWAASRAAVGAATTAGVGLLGAAALVATDPAGRMIVGVAALALLSLAALGGLRRPRLAISAAHGEPRLLVHGLRHVKSFGPADITQVRVTRQRRVGRRTALLEVDVIDGAAERLLIFSRWDLGTDPDDVLAAMSEYHLVPPTR